MRPSANKRLTRFPVVDVSVANSARGRSGRALEYPWDRLDRPGAVVGLRFDGDYADSRPRAVRAAHAYASRNGFAVFTLLRGDGVLLVKRVALEDGRRGSVNYKSVKV